MAKALVVTPEIFKIVKTMIGAGVSQREVADCMKMSQTGISRINSATDYDDWKNKRRIRSAKKKEGDPVKAEPQVVETKQTIVVQASQLLTEEMKKTNELLTLINNKLGAIIDDLYGTKNA